MSVLADDTLEVRSAWTALRTGQLVEWGVTIVALGLSALIVGSSFDAAISTWLVADAIAALTVWIVVQDVTTFTIPDGAVVSIAFFALADRWVTGDSLPTCGVDILLTGGLLFAFREIYYRRKGFDGLGLGDVKLAAAGGFLVGATAFAWALLAASLMALGIAASRSVMMAKPGGFRPNATDKLAFGAVLAPSILGAWVLQHAWLFLPPAGS